MTHHLVCMTIDTDPDGSCGKTINRNARSWRSLELAFVIPEELGQAIGGRYAPITWFVRADGQLRYWYGTSAYLLHEYGKDWRREAHRGSEIAWHPHLYRVRPRTKKAVLIDEPLEACDELHAIWEELAAFSFKPLSFRNGEAWHHKETLAAIETFGITCDSSAVPGRQGADGHPMDWMGAPTTPYHPAPEDIRRPGSIRSLLEVPMSTWAIQAPWDNKPITRYINPAVHEALFLEALERLRREQACAPEGLRLWVLVMHPEEIEPSMKPDGFISHTPYAVFNNMRRLIESFERENETWEWSTLRSAAARWREQPGAPT